MWDFKTRVSHFQAQFLQVLAWLLERVVASVSFSVKWGKKAYCMRDTNS